MTDDGIRLDEKQIAQFVEKFRDLGLKDPSAAKGVIEVLEASFRQDKNEECFEIARTICEILEPERLGGLVSWNCTICREMLDEQEIENKVDTCFSCRVKGLDSGWQT